MGTYMHGDIYRFGQQFLGHDRERGLQRFRERLRTSRGGYNTRDNGFLRTTVVSATCEHATKGRDTPRNRYSDTKDRTSGTRCLLPMLEYGTIRLVHAADSCH